MKVLVIGRGGREHAIASAVAKSKLVKKVFIAPGNAGTTMLGTNVDINELDNERLVNFAISEKIDLTIVGPDAALMNGVVDDFSAKGLKIFGPNLAAAIIEGSKEFTKVLMEKYNIPTAGYAVFTDYTAAKEYCLRHGAPIVIKYDGLAAGKGVTVAMSIEEAIAALDDIFINNRFSGKKVVIEDFLEGEEFSLMAFVYHDKVFPMATARDHKRAYDNDCGPNTGGMGAYSPVAFVTPAIYESTVKDIMIPTAKAMVSEGRPFIGVLYGGLILTNQGPKVIEFNARFGDPETEVVLPRLKNDFVETVLDVLAGKDINLVWDEEVALGVVMASKGYPDAYEGNYPLNIPETTECYHMGTKMKDSLVTNGGRVLFVLGRGKDMEAARKCAYAEVKKVKCDNLFYRKDIGKSEVIR